MSCCRYSALLNPDSLWVHTVLFNGLICALFHFSLYIVPFCIPHDYVFTEQMHFSFAAPNSMIHN